MFRSLISGRPVCSSGIPLPPPEKSVCITGHRENGITPYLHNEKYRTITVSAVKLMLYHKIDIAIEKGYNVFIDGLAMGTDLWAADYIAEKKKNGSNIMLIGVIPFLRHAEFFPSGYREMLKYAEENADYLVTTNDNPNIIYRQHSDQPDTSPTLYRDRNYFMVKNSSAVIAFFEPKHNRSGTAQTVNYARKKDRQIFSFGLDEIYKIIERSNGDISLIKQNIADTDISADGFG